MSVSNAPSIYSVYHGGFGYSSPASPTPVCPTPSYAYPHLPISVGNNCFPPGFATRPPQTYGLSSHFQRNTLSAKNLQAFNAYQTHLYPDMYTDMRQQGKSSAPNLIHLCLKITYNNNFTKAAARLQNLASFARKTKC